MVPLIGMLSMLFFPIAFVIFIVLLICKKPAKRTWGIITIVTAITFGVALGVSIAEDKVQPEEEPSASVQPAISTYPPASTQPPVSAKPSVENSREVIIDGEQIDGGKEEIESDGFLEKLMSFGFTEEEAAAGRKILLRCGIPTIDGCEPTDANATIDGLVSFRERYDKDRVVWFTVENRRIFYVSLNGEDLYDEDKGGYLKNYADVHVPETTLTYDEKQEMRYAAEDELDKYFGYDVRYYDGWAVAREDDEYMIQCQASDGSILTDNWILCCVWFEKEEDGNFIPTDVKIGGKYYKVK